MLCKVNPCHPDCQLTAVTVTEGKREYSVAATAVTIDVPARPNSNTRTNLMLGPEDTLPNKHKIYKKLKISCK